MRGGSGWFFLCLPPPRDDRRKATYSRAVVMMSLPLCGTPLYSVTPKRVMDERQQTIFLISFSLLKILSHHQVQCVVITTLDIQGKADALKKFNLNILKHFRRTEKNIAEELFWPSVKQGSLTIWKESKVYVGFLKNILFLIANRYFAGIILLHVWLYS